MDPGAPPSLPPPWHWRVAAVACVALLGAKLWLISRINVNWDEFNFLSHVFESTRGDLRLLLQGAFVHLFRWLPLLDGNEVDLVLAGRFAVWPLLAVTAFFIWRLASVWISKPIALVAVICYLSTWPVLVHGASFRYDSLIVALITASAWLITRSVEKPRTLYMAALLFGTASALSIKSLLFAPMLAALIVVRLPGALGWSARPAAMRLASFAALAMAVTTLLLLLHGLTLGQNPHAADGFARVAFKTMLLDVPFFPRGPVFSVLRHADAFFWTLLAAGFLCAAAQPRYRSACVLLLALSPLVFYRNAWPYFYVVMLAPACIFTAVAVETAARFLVSRSQTRGAALIVTTFIVAFAARGALHVAYLGIDRQSAQRAVVNAVHQVFPSPVPYVDHSGMIASFPKANLFMSTWGMSRYREAGRSFMDDAIASSQPKFMLLNRWELDARGNGARILLPRDREVLVKHYLPYLGPIYVAGTEFDLSNSTETATQLPFAGRYRLESEGPAIINGVLHGPGDVIEFATTELQMARQSPELAVRGRLVTAAARPLPEIKGLLPMISADLYTGL